MLPIVFTTPILNQQILQFKLAWKVDKILRVGYQGGSKRFEILYE